MAWCKTKESYCANTPWFTDLDLQTTGLQLPASSVTIEELGDDDAPSPWGPSGRSLQKEYEEAQKLKEEEDQKKDDDKSNWGEEQQDEDPERTKRICEEVQRAKKKMWADERQRAKELLS